MFAAADRLFTEIEIGIKHDHDGQRNSPRNAKASTPFVKTEQGGLKVEGNNIPFEDDIIRLTREVERLRLSVQTLEKDREEHISIMRHLVHEMSQNHVELSDIVRERLDRHAPSVIHKHSSTQHVHAYPYTPSQSSRTPTVVKRERVGSLNTRWVPSPFSVPAQDFPKGEHSSFLFPVKRQRTDSTGPDGALLSILPDSESVTQSCTPMSLSNSIPRFDQQIRKQPKLGLINNQNLPDHQHTTGSSSKKPEMSFITTEDTKTSVRPGGDEGIRRRPSSEFARPEGIRPPPYIEYTSEDQPSYQLNDDFPDLLRFLATHEAGDAMLKIDPVDWEESIQYATCFADDPFDTSLRDDWTSFENSFPPEQ
jgi:hypothetical protein